MFMTFPISRALRTLLIASSSSALLMTAACGGNNDPTGPARVATSIVAQSGDGQSGTIGDPLVSPLVVRVVDQNGRALEGATVTWNVTTGGGSLAFTETRTRADGTSENRWTLGMSAGTGSVAARIGGLAPQTATFTATAFLRQ